MTDEKYLPEYVFDISGKKPFFVPIKTLKSKKIKLINDEAEPAELGCSGICIGTYHKDGFDAMMKWYKKNPNWEKEYFQ